jgi:hypothetical protein
MSKTLPLISIEALLKGVRPEGKKIELDRPEETPPRESQWSDSKEDYFKLLNKDKAAD